MHPESLKMFCDLVRLRSFSKAAAANETSQPTVSRLVQRLEERLGGELIDRSKRPLQLTALGQAYYDGCKGLLDRYIERSAELGLVSYPKRSKELTVLPWREEEMVVACSPRHALADCRKVAPIRLEGERFVAFDKGLVIRRKVDRFLKDHGVEVAVAAEFDNIETIKKGIEAGAGVGLLPEPMLRQEVQTGTLTAVRLEGCRLMRPLGIIHRRPNRLSAATQGFIELLLAKSANPSANGKLHTPDNASAHRRRATR